MFTCSICKQTKSPEPNSCGWGYLPSSHDTREKVCYACCGEHDKASMRDTGKAVLYLTHESFNHGLPGKYRDWTDGTITNWPGTLKLPCRVKRGSHNIARIRYDAWFKFEGKQWHGTSYGDNTQIIRCKQTKG